MNIFNSILLGIVQGLTEFLPISSSGHLVLLQTLLPNFSQPGVLFDVILHLGTLLSVVVYFHKKLIVLIGNNLKFIIIATIPAAIIGLILSDFLESLFTLVIYVGFEFLVNAAMSFYIANKSSGNNKLTYKNSFFIGVAQALAISPGISRSGSTIFAGTLAGLKKEEAAEFSFIISIPAVAGAIILQLIKHGDNLNGDLIQYFIGAVVSFLFGIIAIRMVMEFVKKGKFMIFAIYSLILGVIVIALNL